VAVALYFVEIVGELSTARVTTVTAAGGLARSLPLVGGQEALVHAAQALSAVVEAKVESVCFEASLGTFLSGWSKRERVTREGKRGSTKMTGRDVVRAAIWPNRTSGLHILNLDACEIVCTAASSGTHKRGHVVALGSEVEYFSLVVLELVAEPIIVSLELVAAHVGDHIGARGRHIGGRHGGGDRGRGSRHHVRRGRRDRFCGTTTRQGDKRGEVEQQRTR